MSQTVETKESKPLVRRSRSRSPPSKANGKPSRSRSRTPPPHASSSSTTTTTKRAVVEEDIKKSAAPERPRNHRKLARPRFVTLLASQQTMVNLFTFEPTDEAALERFRKDFTDAAETKYNALCSAGTVDTKTWFTCGCQVADGDDRAEIHKEKMEDLVERAWDESGCADAITRKAEQQSQVDDTLATCQEVAINQALRSFPLVDATSIPRGDRVSIALPNAAGSHGSYLLETLDAWVTRLMKNVLKPPPTSYDRRRRANAAHEGGGSSDEEGDPSYNAADDKEDEEDDEEDDDDTTKGDAEEDDDE